MPRSIILALGLLGILTETLRGGDAPIPFSVTESYGQVFVNGVLSINPEVTTGTPITHSGYPLPPTQDVGLFGYAFAYIYPDPDDPVWRVSCGSTPYAWGGTSEAFVGASFSLPTIPADEPMSFYVSLDAERIDRANVLLRLWHRDLNNELQEICKMNAAGGRLLHSFSALSARFRVFLLASSLTIPSLKHAPSSSDATVRIFPVTRGQPRLVGVAKDKDKGIVVTLYATLAGLRVFDESAAGSRKLIGQCLYPAAANTGNTGGTSEMGDRSFWINVGLRGMDGPVYVEDVYIYDRPSGTIQILRYLSQADRYSDFTDDGQYNDASRFVMLYEGEPTSEWTYKEFGMAPQVNLQRSQALASADGSGGATIVPLLSLSASNVIGNTWAISVEPARLIGTMISPGDEIIISNSAWIAGIVGGEAAKTTNGGWQCAGLRSRSLVYQATARAMLLHPLTGFQAESAEGATEGLVGFRGVGDWLGVEGTVNGAILEPPELQLRLLDGTVELEWSTKPSGCILESAPVVGKGANWSAVGVQPIQDGSKYRILLPALERTTFFRLRVD